MKAKEIINVKKTLDLAIADAKKRGSDEAVISIDAAKAALQAIKTGKRNLLIIENVCRLLNNYKPFTIPDDSWRN